MIHTVSKTLWLCLLNLKGGLCPKILDIKFKSPIKPSS